MNAHIKKAKGFEYEETTTEIWIDDDGNRKQQVRKYRKYSVPDTGAAIFLLKNYKPNKYRNYNDLTKAQINAELRKTEAEITKMQEESKYSDVSEQKIDDYIELARRIVASAD